MSHEIIWIYVSPESDEVEILGLVTLPAPFEYNGVDICDACDVPTLEHQLYQLRTRRPSDHYDYSCVMAVCFSCNQDQFGGSGKTGAEWNTWIESDEAADMGIIFLT